MTPALRTALVLGLAGVTTTLAPAQTPGFGGLPVGTFSPPHASAYFQPAPRPLPTFGCFGPAFPPPVFLNPVSPFAVTDVGPIAPRPPVSLPVAMRAPYTTQVTPGWSIPVTLATYEPGRYVPRTSWLAVNPSTGSLFNAAGNTFFRADGMYQYNPWTGQYEQPLTGARFDPRTGITTRQLGNPPRW